MGKFIFYEINDMNLIFIFSRFISLIFWKPLFIIVSAFTFFGALILYKVTNLFIPLRVSDEAERIGLDLSQHDERF